MSSGTPRTSLVTQDDHGAWVTVVAALLLTWMLCVYLVRIFIRLRFTPWGWDDNIVTFGTVVAIAQVATVCEAVQLGLGKRQALLSDSQLWAVQKTLYISQILYIIALGASKCATAVLILRLTRTKAHGLATYIVIGVTTAWAVASVFVISLRGDKHHPWTAWDQPGSGLFPRWITIEVVGMLIELAIVGLSITLVYFLQMKLKLKVMVVGAFFMRVFVIVPAIVRLYYIRPAFNVADPTFNNVYALMLTQVAMHYGLIAASIPCLKPFIRPFDAGYVGDTVDGYNELSNPNGMFPVKTRTSSHSSGMVMNSVNSGGSKVNSSPISPTIADNRKKSSTNFKGIWKGKGKQSDTEKSIGMSSQTSNRRPSRTETWTSKGVRLHTSGNHGDALRPDLGEMITVVEHSPHPHPSLQPQHPSEMGDMVIRQTKEYEVQFEKVDDTA